MNASTLMVPTCLSLAWSSTDWKEMLCCAPGKERPKLAFSWKTSSTPVNI